MAEAAGTAGSRAKLDADAAAVQKTLGDLRAERDALRKSDTEADNRKELTRVLLGRVNERIDLLTDLKRFAAEYATARKDRSDGEQKRMDQRAAERMARDAEPWSRFFALDHSKAAADLSELLSAYYKELIDLDEKGENLERQKERLNKLIELTRKQTEDVAKLRTLLEKYRTRPEAAPWDGWLAGQLAPGGLKAEADVYHDEVARLTAVGGANARRVAALTGNAAPEKPVSAADQTQLAATGGEIGQARAELLTARVRGLTVTGVKIGAVLLAALLVPPVLMFILRRAIRGGTDAAGNPSPVLAALRGVLKIGTWIAAAALVLSVLGYDVTALVGGLAIGVLAIALAARPMIADVLGSVVIFAERRFQVGDVVRLGGGEPARVVGLTWRSTALKSAAGLVMSTPNRKVTEGTVENLSRGTETYDTLAVTISTDKDAGRVVGVIRAALAQCKNLSPTDQGVTVVKFNQRGPVKVVEYRFWWFLKDYEVRNKTRDEVFARIAVGLAHEDMTGIEVTLA
ncbi:mechanosensitive ion channel domain-containing protein [Frigoriglobus tundricola]|uniref:mechanosensitive ion channel domain-containing protein n=1 Tax=Frigoriglobus tundricola TaxID=2774151 RepID=UPI00148ED30B|nr:mechanosensitive ion channel domain-containing protein [Frigoriglobus tundricola]